MIPLFRAERIISFRYSSAHRRAVLCRAERSRAEPRAAGRSAGFRPLTTIEDSLLALCSPRSSSFARLLSLSLSFSLTFRILALRGIMPSHCSPLSVSGDFSGRAALTPDHLTKVRAFPTVIGQPGVVVMMMMRFPLSGNCERGRNM